MVKLRFCVKGLALVSSFLALSMSAKADGSIKDVPSAAPFSWTGFYFGAHIGYGKVDDAGAVISPANAATAAFVGPVLGVPGGVPDSYSVSPDGALGGGQIGYNWQSGSLVAGIEADISAADLEETQDIFSSAALPTNRFTTKVDWLATVRARVGVVAASNILLYATGGFAFADVDQSIFVSAANGDAFSGSKSDTVEGWTVGGGLEWALDRNWSIKGEYLFVSLDSDDFQTGPAGGGCTPTNCVLNVNTSDVDIQTGRIGINYNF